VGTYTVRVSLNGHQSYNNFQNTTTFTVQNTSKININSTINIAPDNITPNEIVTISGVLSNQANGEPVSNVTLNITISGYGSHMYAITDTNGDWSLNYTHSQAGNYTVTVSNIMDGIDSPEYNDFTNTSSFNVNKINVNSTINVPDNISVNEPTVISGVLTDQSNGKAVDGAMFDGHVGEQTFVANTNQDGEWNITYTPPKRGEHTVTVSITDHPFYNDFTNTTNFNVNGISVNSTILADNTTVNNPTIISGTLSTANGTPLSGLALDLKIGNNTTTVITGPAGQWSKTDYTPTTPGNYTVTISLRDDPVYNDFTNSTSFNVIDPRISVNSTINIVPDPVMVDEPTSINGTLRTTSSTTVSGVTLNLTINDETVNVTTMAGGTWSYNYTPTTTGEHTVRVSLNGHPQYRDFINTSSFTVIGQGKLNVNSTIDVPDDVNVGDNININGVLRDEEGVACGGVNLNVTISNGDETFSYNSTTTIPNGFWSLSFTAPDSGNYSVVVSLTGHPDFNDFSNSTNFTVIDIEKLDVSSTINVPSEAVVGDNISINGTLTNLANGEGVADVALDFTYVVTTGVQTTSKETYEVVTDEDGEWNITYTPDKAGEHTVTVSLTGHQYYNDFSNSARFIVQVANRISANSTINVPTDAVVGEETTIYGTVNDENGHPVGGVTLDLKIGNNNTTVKTIPRGEWTYTYTPQSGGEHTVIVSLKDNPVYNDFTNTSSFTVKDPEKGDLSSTIEVPTDAVVGYETTMNGTLTNQCNPVGGVTLDLKIGDSTSSVTTNENGEWTYTYTPQIGGEHTVIISLKNHQSYNDFTQTTTFNVQDKLDVNSTIEVPTDAVVGEATTINGTVTDKNGKPASKYGISLHVTIDDKIYVVQTYKPQWSLTLFIPERSGEHTVTVSQKNHPYYNDFTNSTTFTVTDPESRIDVNSTINVPTDASVGEETTINGTLRNKSGAPPRNNVTLDITIDNEQYTTSADYWGDWELNYTPETVGEHIVTVSLTDHPLFNDFTNTSSFTVQNNRIGVNSTINIPDNIIVGESFDISGVLTNQADGSPVGGVGLNLTFSNVDSGHSDVILSVTTNNNGQWSTSGLSVHPDTNLGVYNVSISLAGHTLYQDFRNTTSFTVNKVDDRIATHTIMRVENSKTPTVTVWGVVKDSSGKYLDNVDITIKQVNLSTDNYSIDTQKTSQTGGWSITNSWENYNYWAKVIVSWSGNQTHKGFTNETTFFVATPPQQKNKYTEDNTNDNNTNNPQDNTTTEKLLIN
jgi:protocatechuate 3,4-dioxygenase beta subunit